MFLALLTLLVALSLSAIAAYYSIIGLAAIFASAVIPIIVMGSILEVSKLTVTVWLHQNWNRASFVMKSYLVPAVIILMIITSMGIFGFLSKAHIEQTSAATEQVAQLVRMDEDVLRQRDIIARAEARITKGEASADKQDVGIQDKIDREQERIDSAYSRRQPSIDEQQAIITAQGNSLANRVAVFQDEITSLDTGIVRLNDVAESYRDELAGVSVASVEKQIQPYIDQLAQLDADLERINTQANQYEARISDVNIDTSTVDSLKQQIATVEDNIVVTTNKLQSRERNKIQEGQAIIGVSSDGLWGGNTRRALATWVDAQQARIVQLQAQETDLRTQAQATVDTERTRLTDLVTDLRSTQTTRIDERKQALLDTIDLIRADAASGLDTQRASIQAKIDNLLNIDIPANREARKAAQSVITELRNKEDPSIVSARAEIARIRAVAEGEIANGQAVIARLRSQIQVGDDVDLDTLIDKQNDRIRVANNEIDSIIEAKFALEAQARKLEAEVGPIKYIAEFVYGEQADKNMLEKAVTWVIILIVFVFDPLAIMMLLAATSTLTWRREDKATALPIAEIPKETTLNEIQTFKNMSEYTTLFPEDLSTSKGKDSKVQGSGETANSTRHTEDGAPVGEEIGNSRDDDKELGQSPKKVKVHVERIIFPEYDIKIDDAPTLPTVTDHPSLDIDTIVAGYNTLDSYNNIKATKPATTVVIADDTEDEKQAKRIWKRVNPDATLKEQESLFSNNIIDKLPWVDYLELSDNEIEENYTTVEFGTEFPDRAVKGDTYIRVDYLPSKVFKWNGQIWIEVDKNSSDTFAYNEKYIQHLIEKLGSGEYDPELLNDAERSQLEQQLRNQEL